MNAPPKDIFIKISFTEVSLKHRAGLSTHTNFPVLNQGIITLNDIGNKKSWSDNKPSNKYCKPEILCKSIASLLSFIFKPTHNVWKPQTEDFLSFSWINSVCGRERIEKHQGHHSAWDFWEGSIWASRSWQQEVQGFWTSLLKEIIFCHSSSQLSGPNWSRSTLKLFRQIHFLSWTLFPDLVLLTG